MTGVALLGGGLLAATAASTVAQAAVPFAAAAVGAGLVSSVGFPYFARFVPEGEAGQVRRRVLLRARDRVRRRAAGRRRVIAVTGSYRALLAMGALGLAGPRAARAGRAGRALARRPAHAAADPRGSRP